MSGKVTPALLVDAFKIGMPEQVQAPRKIGPSAQARQIGTAVRSTRAHRSRSKLRLRNPAKPKRRESLLTETGFHRNPFTTLGAPARNHRATALGLHARTEAVRLRAVPSVGLECAL